MTRDVHCTVPAYLEVVRRMKLLFILRRHTHRVYQIFYKEANLLWVAGESIINVLIISYILLSKNSVVGVASLLGCTQSRYIFSC